MRKREEGRGIQSNLMLNPMTPTLENRKELWIPMRGFAYSRRRKKMKL
jgi:hypothetical protein